MATKKTTETTVDVSTMNIYNKLLAVRQEFALAGAQKSGINTHADFTYFELADIVPTAEPIFAKYGLILIQTFENSNAIARVINTDKPEEAIEFTIPIELIAEPAKFRMNEVQAVGAMVTYYRRYLYMIVLNLVESDGIDGEKPVEDKPAPAAPKKPATTEERKEIKENLTSVKSQAGELQIKALKAALQKLKSIDPSKEEFIQKIVIKTDKFSKISVEACEGLILKINEMIENYNTQEETDDAPF